MDEQVAATVLRAMGRTLLSVLAACFLFVVVVLVNELDPQLLMH